MRHEHGDGRMRADMLRRAADDELAQAAVAVAAHDEKIGLRPPRGLPRRQDARRRRHRGAPDSRQAWSRGRDRVPCLTTWL